MQQTEQHNNLRDSERPSSDFWLTAFVTASAEHLEELRELTMCLAAQDYDRFEVVFLPEPAQWQNQLLDEALAELCDYLSEVAKIGATRMVLDTSSADANSLTLALRNTRAGYFAFLKPTDILLDNWVSGFRQAAKAHKPVSPESAIRTAHAPQNAREAAGSNAVLHAYALRQDWEAYLDTAGLRKLRAVGSLSDCYCQDFDLSKQLLYNNCPGCSLAFPVEQVRDAGLGFDAALPHLGDWDFLMRAAMAFGVVNFREVTSIRRKLDAADCNAPVSVEELGLYRQEYLRARGSIVDALSGAGRRAKAANVSTLLPAANGLAADDHLLSSEFLQQCCYVNIVSNDRDEQAVVWPMPSSKAGYDLAFAFRDVPCGTEVQLAFSGLPSFTVHGFSALLVSAAGETQGLALDDCRHKGLQVDGYNIIFLEEAATIILGTKNGFSPVELHVKISARKRVSAKHAQQVLKGKRAVFVGRAWRHLKRRMKNA